MDDQTASNGANSVAMDDSAWSSGSPAQPTPPIISGSPNVPATAPMVGNAPSQPQAPAQAPTGATPAIPTRRFEKPGEFFHAAAHAIGGALLGTMAGSDPTEYSRDENGALVKTQPATSTGDKLRRIAQAALTGLSAGANAPRRPGAEALSGLGAGFSAETKGLQDADLQKQKQADEDFDTKQRTLLRKHDIAHQNALTVATYYGNLKLKNEMNPMFAENESLMKAAKASPDLAGHVQEMTDAEVDAAQQDDPHWGADHIVKPLGWAPVIDNEGHQVMDADGKPKEYMRVGVINGATEGTSIAITSEAAAAVKKYGPNAQIANADNITAGTVVPFQKYIQMMNAVDLERKNELQGWAKPEVVFGGKDGKTPMQQNSVTKEVRPMPKDADGNPIIPNVKNLPAESQATVDNKEGKGDVTPRDKFIQDREDKRQAAREAAEDKRKANSGTSVGDYNPAGSEGLQGDDYLAALAPQDQTVLKAIGEGRETMNLQNRKGELTPLGQAVMRAYPDYDIAKAKNYPKLVEDFQTGKMSQTLTAYGTAINHARSLLDNTGPASYIPGTAENKRYNQDVSFVAREVAKALVPNGTPTEGEIREQEENLKSYANRREAILNAARILTGKMSEVKQRWANGQVRKSYQPPMPNLSPDALENMEYLATYGRRSPAGNPSNGNSNAGKPQMPPGATHIVPGPDGKNHYTNSAGTIDLGVAP